MTNREAFVFQRKHTGKGQDESEKVMPFQNTSCVDTSYSTYKVSENFVGFDSAGGNNKCEID